METFLNIAMILFVLLTLVLTTALVVTVILMIVNWIKDNQREERERNAP